MDVGSHRVRGHVLFSEEFEPALINAHPRPTKWSLSIHTHITSYTRSSSVETSLDCSQQPLIERFYAMPSSIEISAVVETD
jgi:hypothetical protein